MTSVQVELSSAHLLAESNMMLTYALNASDCGYSFIPLKGGRNRVTGKRPRIAWQIYQTQYASKQQIEEWFNTGTSAYGICLRANLTIDRD